MSESDSTAPESGMASGNDAPIGGRTDALPLDEAETLLLDELRRSPRPAQEDDPVILSAARDDTVISLDAGGQRDALTPLFTEP